MNDENVRINMVINRYENPLLFAMLTENPMKVRASLMRQAAEFGVWARASGLKLTATGTPHITKEHLQVEPKGIQALEVNADPASNKSASEVRLNTTHSLRKKGNTAHLVQPQRTAQAAAAPLSTASNYAPVRAEVNESLSSDDVLDTSVLSNFDLGDLD